MRCDSENDSGSGTGKWHREVSAGISERRGGNPLDEDRAGMTENHKTKT